MSLAFKTILKQCFYYIKHKSSRLCTRLLYFLH